MAMGAALATELESKSEIFEATALIHMDSLYRFALHMSGNESDAEDLVQDTYLKAYKFFDRFRAGTNCKAWLLTILRNTFINTVRRDRGHPHMIHLPEMEERGMEALADSDTEDEIFGDLLDDDVTGAINALPDEYRAAVLLADMEGLPYKEIADIMDCPIGTVMSRLYRGRRLLRKKLYDYAARYGYTGKSDS
jgi:RNA polymerase sigma-70 factor (ECF subfamily)